MNVENAVSNVERGIESYTRWVIKWRWPVLLLALVATLGLGSGGRFIQFKNDYRYFFSEENPQLLGFEAIQNIYNKNDNLLFVVEAKSGNVFNTNTLAAVEWLAAEAEYIPSSSRVDSLSNYQHTEAFGDDVEVDDLYYDATSLTPEDIDRIRRVAFSEPLLLNRLVTTNQNVLGVNVTVELPDDDARKATEVVVKAREIREQFLEKFPGHNVYMSGMVPLSNAFAESAQWDMQHLLPLMYLAIMVVTVIMVRSFAGSLTTIVVIFMSVLSGMGVAGWLGIPLTPPSSMSPVVISTLAVADSIHILVTLLHEMANGRNKREAIVESMRINMQPVFLTSLTTAIGFLSMNFSDAPPFRDLGNIVAIGVTFAFVYSVLVLPALMALLPVRVKVRAAGARAGRMEQFAEWVIRKRKPLLYIGLAVIAILTSFITRNELDDKFVEYFDETTEFRQSADFMMENLTGVYTVEYNIGADGPSGINEPAYQARLDAFAGWWRAKPSVMHVNTFSDVMKRINRSMNGDDETKYVVPENRQLAAQFLLLYGNSLPRGFGLDNQINVDESSTRFIVTLDNVSARELRTLAQEGEKWLQEHAPEYMHAIGVSPAIMFSYISERNIKSMLTGTTVALVLISGILMIALRSFRFGLISLLPNLAPAAISFGIWGLLVGRIGLSLSVVTAMSLGIVVDDTVHFLSKYARARREKGLDSQEAVRYAFSSVGRALVATSVILVIGFSILSLSSFELNRGLGRLTAIVIVVALSADFLVLPPILMALGKTRLSVKQKEASV